MISPQDLRSPQVPAGADALAAREPVLALDLGGTRVRAAVVMPDGTVAGRREQATPLADAADAVLDACQRLLSDVRAEVAPGGEPRLIGVSCPGPLDAWNGVMLDPPNMGPTFHDVGIGERLEAALSLPVFVERDTLVAALGEAVFGAARGCRDFLYLTVSTGIGGAVVSDGHLLLGPDGTFGELGHITVDMDGEPCGCGGRGHLEALASGTGILGQARIALDGGATTVLREFAGVAGRPSARDVADAAERGDQVAASIMDRARRAFAAACVSFVDIFDPDVIVVGGAIADGQGDRMLDPARALIEATAFRLPRRRVRIEPAALGQDVGLVGAFVLATIRSPDPRWRGGRPLPG